MTLSRIRKVYRLNLRHLLKSGSGSQPLGWSCCQNRDINHHPYRSHHHDQNRAPGNLVLSAKSHRPTCCSRSVDLHHLTLWSHRQRTPVLFRPSHPRGETGERHPWTYSIESTNRNLHRFDMNN